MGISELPEYGRTVLAGKMVAGMQRLRCLFLRFSLQRRAGAYFVVVSFWSGAGVS